MLAVTAAVVDAIRSLRNESLSLMLGSTAHDSMDFGKAPWWYLALSTS